MLRHRVNVAVYFALLAILSSSQQAQTLTAESKGPSQINLKWHDSKGHFDSYQVEVQSDDDARYSTRTVLAPVRAGSGFGCDSSVVINGATCTLNDLQAKFVLAPPKSIPHWVTEGQYVDPIDSSPAQFIVTSLKPATRYHFWVRAFPLGSVGSGESIGDIVSSTNNDYSIRYVSPSGNDSNDGASRTNSWRTLAKASSMLRCGQVLMVGGGTYEADSIVLSQNCTAQRKAVVLVQPRTNAVLISPKPGAISISGNFVVIDGLEVSSRQGTDYDVIVQGSHNSLLNVEVHAAMIPTNGGGVEILGNNNLVYGSYLHDYGSPDGDQNPSGNNGFVLSVLHAHDNVVWNNHLTRGGHDVSLCKDSCSWNRWLNNIMDGGWGMGWNAIAYSDFNLVEGNIVAHAGRFVNFYKPGIEVSSNHNTARRNLIFNAAHVGIEISALMGTALGNRIYNNTVAGTDNCLFVSANGGNAGYEDDLFANNICHRSTTPATDIYPGVKSFRLLNNAFISIDAGKLVRGGSVIIWNRSANGDFQYPRSVAHADSVYSPAFAGNVKLEVLPGFVSETDYDFHLKPGSPLCRGWYRNKRSSLGVSTRPLRALITFGGVRLV